MLRSVSSVVATRQSHELMKVLLTHAELYDADRKEFASPEAELWWSVIRGAISGSRTIHSKSETARRQGEECIYFLENEGLDVLVEVYGLDRAWIGPVINRWIEHVRSGKLRS